MAERGNETFCSEPKDNRCSGQAHITNSSPLRKGTLLAEPVSEVAATSSSGPHGRTVAGTYPQ